MGGLPTGWQLVDKLTNKAQSSFAHMTAGDVTDCKRVRVDSGMYALAYALEHANVHVHSKNDRLELPSDITTGMSAHITENVNYSCSAASKTL